MSLRDFKTYAGIAREFRFHRMRPIFATNSIKLYRVGSKGRFVPHLWIDSPWRILQGNAPFLHSGTYPEVDRPGGRTREREWHEHARGFPGGYLLSLRLVRTRGRVLSCFADGWRIETPMNDPDSDPDSWYDDWYATGRVGCQS
jgi:hypothetical protein